ncbi:putative phage integrase [Salinibacterium xinjiangense]|uniref:Site-specific recombinase XerD n=1 Tax=Salinibacterium xinjiangense TaxID=386302 RepID=A0A2C8ZVT9_9MICO|nr:tyrosine-type recombinase/integrase [Salinibacterium xinjiangense]GGL02836.1 putative phage integrase [Salinibacterium xinjiangense]SOE69887.1 Site-specific recombinase XerD [Salinibacterium xinjiangense]
MGRQAHAVGTYGKVTTAKEGSKYVAKTRLRDLDGVTRPIEASGSSISGAENALRERIAERIIPVGDAALTGETKLRDLATFWLDEVRAERRLNQTTVELYERDTKNLVLPLLGEFRLRELTVGRVDSALKRLSRDGISKGKHGRVVLSLMMGLATRHDAVLSNPVRDAGRLPKSDLTPRALTVDELHALRTAIAEWRTGESVLGPRPDGQLATIIEVLLGTSMRIGEVLALRVCDVDVTTTPAVVVIAGTLVNTKKDGLFRQDHPKKARQSRMVAIPEFAAEALRRQLASMGEMAPTTLLFRSREGTALWPNNVRRQWRTVRDGSPHLRGLDLSLVTPHTFRRTVATTLARGSGSALAAEMLGHASEEVTKLHYIEHHPMVNPLTASVLESLAPRRAEEF